MWQQRTEEMWTTFRIVGHGLTADRVTSAGRARATAATEIDANCTQAQHAREKNMKPQ